MLRSDLTISHQITDQSEAGDWQNLNIMAFQSPRHSQNFYQYDASTPPPPPPKPAGHSSGTATPSNGPPLPPPPQQHLNQPYAPPQVLADQLAVQPPEDGWLPDVLKDQTYVRHETYQVHQCSNHAQDKRPTSYIANPRLTTSTYPQP